MIRVELGYHSRPNAEEVSQVLANFAILFREHHAKSGNNGFYLELESIKISSIIFDFFEIMSNITDIIEKREIIRDFFENLAACFNSAKDANVHNVPSHFRNFIYAFCVPIKNKNADYGRITVNGDNNMVIVINGDSANDICVNIGNFEKKITETMHSSVDGNLDEIRYSKRNSFVQKEENILTTISYMGEKRASATLISVNGKWIAIVDDSYSGNIEVVDDANLLRSRQRHLRHRGFGYISSANENHPDVFFLQGLEEGK